MRMRKFVLMMMMIMIFFQKFCFVDVETTPLIWRERQIIKFFRAFRFFCFVCMFVQATVRVNWDIAHLSWEWMTSFLAYHRWYGFVEVFVSSQLKINRAHQQLFRFSHVWQTNLISRFFTRPCIWVPIGPAYNDGHLDPKGYTNQYMHHHHNTSHHLLGCRRFTLWISHRQQPIGTSLKGWSRQKVWKSLLQTSQSNIAAGSFLDPQIWQCTASVRTKVSRYTLVYVTRTKQCTNFEMWWRIVAPSLPCSMATPLSLNSTTRKICGRSGGSNVSFLGCLTNAKSRMANVAFGLSYPTC